MEIRPCGKYVSYCTGEWGLDIGVDHDGKMCRASGVLLKRRYRLRSTLERWIGDSAYKGLPG
jgi:hypothetical protein